ncbi:MAG: hypothetical protein WBA28_05480 [Microbacteriaceae bacterium]
MRSGTGGPSSSLPTVFTSIWMYSVVPAYCAVSALQLVIFFVIVVDYSEHILIL